MGRPPHLGWRGLPPSSLLGVACISVLVWCGVVFLSSVVLHFLRSFLVVFLSLLFFLRCCLFRHSFFFWSVVLFSPPPFWWCCHSLRLLAVVLPFSSEIEFNTVNKIKLSQLRRSENEFLKNVLFHFRVCVSFIFLFFLLFFSFCC